MAKGGKRIGSGRKRKPTEMRVLEGTFRKDRHGRAPQVAAGFPQAPTHLTKSERGLWEAFPRVAWIAESDAQAVNAAVSVFDRILSNQRGQAALAPVDRPFSVLVEKELKLWGRLMSILATLGLTPADRAKVTAPKDDEQNPDKWAGLL